MMKHVGWMTLVLCVAVASTAFAGGHYKLGSAWDVGEGTYIITDDGDNRVLCAAAIDGNDPKHAWVNQDFGSDYTVRCDVNMLTWANAEDHSRAGIAGRILPKGMSADRPDNDVGVNLLLHDNTDNVQFLNDLRGWGDNEAFTWAPRTWYTFEITFSGNNVSGSITNKDNPADMIELAEWADFTAAEDRQTGFVGVTGSTKSGLVAYFDNFEVEVGGQVVFSDDFEGTAAAPSAVGTNDVWMAGEAGYYVVQGGQLFGIATNGVDPKHMWYNGALVGGGSIEADVTMLSWAGGEDHSRAGLALHIQPNGTAPDGEHDRGINLLLHQDEGRIQFLNDLRAWGDQEAIEWTIGTTYAFSMASDGTTVSASVGGTALAPWEFPDPQNRADGFAGITPSTLAGEIVAIDNVVIKNAAGAVVYQDDFETIWGTSDAAGWELFK